MKKRVGSGVGSGSGSGSISQSYGSRDPDPHLRLMDPDPGGPKTWGSCGSGSGSPTLVTPAQDLTRQDKKLVSRSACLLPEQAYLIYAW